MTEVDISLFSPLPNFVLMSYLPLKLEICYFLDFSMVKIIFFFLNTNRNNNFSCIPEQFASKSKELIKEFVSSIGFNVEVNWDYLLLN